MTDHQQAQQDIRTAIEILENVATLHIEMSSPEKDDETVDNLLAWLMRTAREQTLDSEQGGDHWALNAKFTTEEGEQVHIGFAVQYADGTE
jgi:hypothetical protein